MRNLSIRFAYYMGPVLLKLYNTNIQSKYKVSERGHRMTFGQKLKELMEERDLTQRQLGKELNIAATTLNGYANDYREPDFQTLAMIAHYFQVSTDYLLGITNVPKSFPLDNTEQLQRLIHYYSLLTPEFRSLLVDSAKLLVRHSSR